MIGDERTADLEENAAEVFDFLSEYFDDIEEGNQYELDHYLARFPGCEPAIRREYEAQKTRSGDPADSEGSAEPGSRVGPYELLSEIGRGGQGTVYLAEDTRIERRVALKVLPPAALFLSGDSRRRLRREAEVISRLTLPGICGIFDAQIDKELAYIAMPFVEGRTLASAIALKRDGATDLDPDALPLVPQSEADTWRLLSFFEQAARALHGAHEAGVVHRDIKPGNLMVTPDGQPVWLDFGLARDDQSGALGLTMPGEIFGTPAYISPEQITGGTVDARTDVWALAVSLFECLTLRRPYEAPSVHVLLLSIQLDEPKELRRLNPHVGEELAVVVATGLERDLQRRYSSALAFAEDLARIQRHEPIHARPASTILRLERWVQRHPVLFVGLLAMLVSLFVVSWSLVKTNEALESALGRHLAGRSEELLDEDPASALILAIEAVQKAPSALTREALFAAMEHCQLRALYQAGHEQTFLDVQLVPHKPLVAAVRQDGRVLLFDRLSGEVLESWQALERTADGTGVHLAVSRDGEWIACEGSNGSICLRSTIQGATSTFFEGPGAPIERMNFGPSNEILLVRIAGGETRQFRVPGGQPTEDPGEVLDAPGEEGALRPGAGELTRRLEDSVSLEFEGPPGAHEFSHDGTRLAVLDQAGVLWLLDSQSFELLGKGLGYFKQSHVQWSEDDEFILTRQRIGPEANLWYGTSRPDIYNMRAGESAVKHVEFSPDGELALSVTEGGDVSLWSTPSAPRLGRDTGRELFRPARETEIYEGAQFSSSGEHFLTWGGQAVTLWTVDPPGTFYLDALPAEAITADLHPSSSHWLVVDSNGEGWVGSWNREPARSVGGVEDPMLLLRWTPSGEHVLAAHESGLVRLLAADTLEDVWAKTPPAGSQQESHAFVDLDFGPEGNVVALACGDRRVHFMHLEDGERARAPLHLFRPATLDWSRDGRRLVVTGQEGRGAVRFEDLLPADPRQNFMRAEDFHSDDLTGGVFSQDGTLVLTSSLDGTIMVRDVRGEPDPRSTILIAHLRSGASAVHCAAFSSGKGLVRVIAGLSDGRLKVWPVDPLPSALESRPREHLRDWELAREQRFAAPLEYR